MAKFSCGYCNEDIEFTNKDDIPDICPHCNTPIDKNKIEISQVSNKITTQQNGIELIYQKTGKKINLCNSPKTIIGRKHVGKEIFNDYISGIHCIIEYENNQYYVTDAESTNGTFLGLSKIDCKTNPKQQLIDGELLFLGKEPFLIRHISSNKKNNHTNNKKIDKKENGKNKIKKYHCIKCGILIDENPQDKICPNPGCKSFDTFEIVLINKET